MAIPDFQTLMLPVLKLGAQGKIQRQQAIEILSDQFNLTEEERAALLPSGVDTYISNRSAWATTFLVKAGLLARPKRGYFTITDRGKEVLATNPDKINIKYLMQFEDFREFRKLKKPQGEVETDSAGTDVSEESQTPEERIGAAHEELLIDLKDQVLERILEMSPTFFERALVKLLVAMGYGGSLEDAGQHLGKSGDGGIDGVINEDKLGLDVIYIQAKRYARDNVVGSPDIQKFAGSLMHRGAGKGVFVTTSSFSKSAVEFADQIPQRLILIAGSQLAELMIEHNVGVRVNRSIDLKKIDEDFFLE